MTEEIRWPEDGLIPAVIQDDESNSVLMVGFMNAEALEATRAQGEVHFWSRSRKQLWHKGASSGHIQHVRSIHVNCDTNALLIRVHQAGSVCHDGYDTCFYRTLQPDGSLELTRERLFDPRDVYGDGYGLAGLSVEWWRAYEYLRDSDLVPESRTSALLHGNDSVLGRVVDELVELAGVLDGTHIHTDQVSDFMLESSQCCYWIVIECLLHGITWEDARPDRALDVPEATVDALLASRVLRAEAGTISTFSGAVANHLLHLVAESARTLSIDPRAILEQDVAQLRTKPYLASYFAR